MFATENIERQIAAIIVVAVEKPPFLFAMQRQVCGVHIQNDLGGSALVRFEEHCHREFVYGPSGTGSSRSSSSFPRLVSYGSGYFSWSAAHPAVRVRPVFRKQDFARCLSHVGADRRGMPACMKAAGRRDRLELRCRTDMKRTCLPRIPQPYYAHSQVTISFGDASACLSEAPSVSWNLRRSGVR